MAKTLQSLKVTMNGFLVGTLTKQTSGVLSFQYDQNWLQLPGTRPISLSLPLTDQKYIGNIVYNFFDNLLPDNPRTRARIQTKFQSITAQPFDLLASIGKDCIGAIQLSSGEKPFIKQVNARPLNKKTIVSLLKNFRDAPLGMIDNKDDFQISIAGTQEKSAFLFYRKKWCRPFNATPTSHIFKLPIGFIEHQNIDLTESCENEWLCTQIAKAFKLPVANATIQHFNDVKALIVERFDRQWSKDEKWLMRLPQEDICQALGMSPNLKYEEDGGPGIIKIMELLIGSKNALADRELFFRSQVLFFLLAAIDGHAKNFSLFIESSGNYHLTPLYDILSAYPLIASNQLQKQKIKMAMALTGKNKQYHWNKIQRRHFISTAKAAKFSLRKTDEILEEMLDQIDSVINIVSLQIPPHFPEHIAHSIFTGMRQVKKKLVKI